MQWITVERDRTQWHRYIFAVFPYRTTSGVTVWLGWVEVKVLDDISASHYHLTRPAGSAFEREDLPDSHPAKYSFRNRPRNPPSSGSGVLPAAPPPQPPEHPSGVDLSYEATLLWYKKQLCEGFCGDLPEHSTYHPSMDERCSGCRARAALAQAKAMKHPAGSGGHK